MHSDLLERARVIRDNFDVPRFPLDAIRMAANRPEQRSHRPRVLTAAIVAGCSVCAIAAAAEIAQQTHIHFVQSGGMVVSSDAKMTSRVIHSDEDIREAASHLDFAAVLPAGLPAGATPMKIDLAGSSLLVVTYTLPESHRLWIFLANPKTMAGSNAPAASPYRVRKGRDHVELWRVGHEQVIVVSDGLAKPQFAAIKHAMDLAAKR